MKKRILYVDFSVGFGGSAICLRDMAGGLSALGHDVIVAFIFQKKGGQEFLVSPIKVVYLGGVVTDIFLKISRYLYGNKFLMKTKITLFLMFFIKVFLDRIPTIAKLFFLIKREKVDLVHVNNGISLPVISAARLGGVPCVVSLRSFVGESVARRSILKNVSRFIAVSTAVRKDFIRKSGIPEDRVSVIYDGISTLEKPAVDPADITQRFNISPADRVVVTVGRLVEWKRQDLLIEACEKILSNDVNIKCFIVGTAEREEVSLAYERKLKDIVAQKGLTKNVIFTGFLDKPLELISIAHVFCLPSITEPFGMVVLESMSLGVPVVAFNDGGPAEIITDGKDGLLVPVGDIDGLAQAISMILSDENFRQTLSREAVEKVNRNFNVERSIAKFDDLYKSCLQGR